MKGIDFQILESRRFLPNDIVCETWFILQKTSEIDLSPIRRDVYKLSGSVVALRDSGVGADNIVYMDESFYRIFDGEPELETILCDQGMFDRNKIKTYSMED